MAEELIDRKALRKDIEERICENCGVRNEPLACHFCKTGRVISRVENAPTVEAKPVVHAHWFLLDDCANEGVYCSACTKKVYKTDYAKKLKSKYCPNCGAQMDELVSNTNEFNNAQKNEC